MEIFIKAETNAYLYSSQYKDNLLDTTSSKEQQREMVTFILKDAKKQMLDSTHKDLPYSTEKK